MSPRQIAALAKSMDKMIDRLTAARDSLPDDDDLREEIANAVDGLHQAHTAVLERVA